VVDIFDEVEEDLRAERAQRLLKRYGGVLVALCLAVIAAGAGWQFWKWRQAQQDAAAATAYMTDSSLADSPNLSPATRSAAISAFDVLAANAPEGYRTLARLRDAALRADGGDIAGAAGMWDQVATDSSADPLLRDLASLLWAGRQIDTGDPALLKARLAPLAAPGNPWRPLAQEQLALLDLRQGHDDAAKTALQNLANDVTAPGGVRGRAGALLSRLSGSSS
jgi:hypothetical protein